MPDRPPPRIRLGDEVPAPIRDFVSCTSDEVVLDSADSSWVPKPPQLGEWAPSPDITFTEGSAPDSGTVGVDFPMAPEATFDVAVVDGQLTVDLSGLGPLADMVGGSIQRFVDDLNAQLADNGKEFGPTSFADGKLTATKRPAGTAAQEDQAPAVAAPAPVATPPAPATEPVPPPGQEDEGKKGCAPWLIGGIVAVLAAVGIGYVATQGDDGGPDEVSTEQSSSSTSSSVEEAADEAPPASDDEPDEEEGTQVSQLDCGTQAVPTGTTEVPGQDPRATLEGVIPVSDESDNLFLVMCFGQPWGPQGPTDVFSYYFETYLDPDKGPPGGSYWEQHDGGFTIQVIGPDAPTVNVVYLTPEGMPMMPTGRTTASLPTVFQVQYRTGSWISEASPPPVYDEGAVQIDLSADGQQVDPAGLAPVEGPGGAIGG